MAKSFLNRIDLSIAPIELGKFANRLPRTMAFKKFDPIWVQDFGTAFIGNPEDADISTPQEGTFTFSAPMEWRMPQLLKALGIFKSASEAAKNGWNMDIPPGCSSHLIRANRVLGEIWIHKEIQ